ncbi:MAG: hypothetical protein JWP89_5595 [Schlesneria sp.]|nr:hypothetical protein [Schlesneria sp.]
MCSRVCLLGSALVLAVGVLIGCSQQVSPPKTVPVSGRVMLNGKGVPGIRVTMHPEFDMGPIKWGVVGDTGPNGTFIVGTGAPGNGAPHGAYVVTLTKPGVGTDPKYGIEIEIDEFEGKYSDPAKSDWKVIVRDGTNVLEPFQLN